MSVASAFRRPEPVRCAADPTHPSDRIQASATHESRQP